MTREARFLFVLGVGIGFFTVHGQGISERIPIKASTSYKLREF